MLRGLPMSNGCPSSAGTSAPALHLNNGQCGGSSGCLNGAGTQRRRRCLPALRYTITSGRASADVIIVFAARHRQTRVILRARPASLR